MFGLDPCCTLAPMKILIQNSVCFPNVIGGAEISSHLLGMELRRRGLEVDAVATTGKRGGSSRFTTRPTEDGLGRVYEAPSHGFVDIFGEDGLPPQAAFPLRAAHHLSSVHSRRWEGLMSAILADCQPDILHTNTIVGMTPVIWKIARDMGISVVHTLRDYHLLCPRTTLLRSDKSDCTRPPLPCRVLASLKLRQTGHVDVVTAPSRFVLDRHLQAGAFPGARDQVVPNACEYLPDQVPERDDLDGINGLFLGQLDEHKGILLILEALDRLFQQPEHAALQFDFAGSGPCDGRVREFCAVHPQRARFHGVVKGQAKFDLLRRAAFQVVPSVWNDNFPRSILDGFSWGLPVIGSARGGIPEVIRHERDGVIIRPEAAELARAMADYVQSPEKRRQHGKSARQRAEGFTLESQVDQFQGIFTELWDNREVRRG